MVDSQGLTKDLEGKKVRLFFRGGDCEATPLTVAVPFGDDLIHEVISTNRPKKYESGKSKNPRSVYSAEFPYLDHWELIDSAGVG
jgi:hypothetical protein